MKNNPRLVAAFLGFLPLSLQADPYETVFFEDDFSGTELSEPWGSWKSETVVRDGVMVGITPLTADHPSVNQLQLPALSDLEVAVSFKFAGSDRFNVMFRDLEYEGSHAGHICHVAVTPTAITLYDGKTGQFRKDIRDQRKAGIPLSEETNAMLRTKNSRHELSLDPVEWHDLVIRIEGDVMTTWIDGEQVAEFQSEGIAHPTKSNINLTTMDREVHYDNFVIRTP